MKITTYISLICASLFLTMACERDTNIPLPSHKSKLVIYSVLNAGASPEVHVTRSASLTTQLDDDFVLLKDATVELFENGNSLGTLIYSESQRRDTTFWGEIMERKVGLYQSPSLRIEGGKEYELKVSHKDYETVTAKTFVNPKPTVHNIRVEQNVALKKDSEGYTTSQSLIHVEIAQTAGTGNYYRLGLMGASLFIDPYDGMEYRQPMFYLADGPAIKEGNTYKADSQWLNGKEKEGQTLQATFLVDLYTFEDGVGVFEREFEELDLVLYSANEDGKIYMETFKRQLDAEELADIPIFPRESVVVYSNVENGYGMIGEISKIVSKIK